MNKGVIVIIFVVIFVFVLLFARYTGMVVTSINTCTDSDGNNFFTKGEVFGTSYLLTKQNFVYEDYCKGDYSLIEYICIVDGINSYKESMKYTCPMGCVDGACVD